MSEAITPWKVPHQSGKSIRTSILIDRLKDGSPGDLVFDEELTRLCGASTGTNGDAYSNLMSAISHVKREYQIVWDRQRGQNCLRCLNADEIMGKVDAQRKHIGRSCNRSVVTLAAVDPKELSSDEERSRYSAYAAQMKSIAVMARLDTAKAITNRGLAKPIDLGGLLEAMK